MSVTRLRDLRHPAAVLCLCLAAVLARPAFAQAPVREITKIAGEVYRFRNNEHYSVFAVTPEGIIATDPIDAGAAAWLKAEIKARFNTPVRYVIYSHAHADHATGGEVFSDTATFVGHAVTRATLARDHVQTPLPTETFADTKTIELGGTVVELRYLGPNHGDGMIVMRFPKERILFVVDIIPVQSIGYRDFPNADFSGWLDSLKQAEAIDFDILAPGHGPMGRKAHVRMHREYLEDLRDQVTRQVKAGTSLEETKRLVNLEKYKAWGSYADMRDLNIEGMYRIADAGR